MKYTHKIVLNIQECEIVEWKAVVLCWRGLTGAHLRIPGKEPAKGAQEGQLTKEEGK